ncbi:MAG: hypothetical protein WDN09_03625 [bacterium]
MIITYFGKQFFKVAQGEMVIAFNPVSKSSKTGHRREVRFRYRARHYQSS